jgi:hypothetical protein
LSVIGPIVLIITLLGAGGVFGYQKFLDKQRDAKSADLTASQKDIDPTTVEEFTRLRDRLSSGSALLKKHVTLSQFLVAIGPLTLQNVQFHSLDITVADDRTAVLKITGEAKSFNALAAQSALLATEPHISRALFSNIKVNKNGFIDFFLTANLSSALLIGGSATLPASSVSGEEVAVPALPEVATTTPTKPATTTVVKPKR